MTVCLLCGRVLKSKESIERGYGDCCYKKFKQMNITTLDEFDI